MDQHMSDEKLVVRVRAMLNHVPGVKERKMFGSIGFMVRGRLSMSARGTRIMCRIDPAGHDAAVRRPGARTVVMKGRAYPGYVYIDAQSLKTKRALQYWVDLALVYNHAKNRTA
jgi:hypothetical protein